MNTIRSLVTGPTLAWSCAFVAAAVTTVSACGSKKSAGASPDGSADDDGGDMLQGGSGSSGGGASSGSPSTSGGASSGGVSSGAASSGAASTGDGGSMADAGDGAVPYDYSVYQHHKNGSRNGLYIDPALTAGAMGNAATMHILTGVDAGVPKYPMGSGSAYMFAQPLYIQNGPGGVPVFVVASSINEVTMYNANTGAVIWDNGPASTTGSTISYGAPVTTGLPCGTISPLGILGTPIIDYSSGQGVIYFDAMTNVSGTAHHKVWAIKVTDGTAVSSSWPVDVGTTVTNFNAPYQNQRGALQFVNGTLYIPYGGLDGDCIELSSPYYGWVVAIPTSSPQHPTAWHTAANRGGIWGPGALPTDGTYVYPVTGNTSAAGTTGFTAPSAWGGGEAVIRLGEGATFSGMSADYYTPMNWQTLDGNDQDLGGASEVLVDMPGTSKPHLVAVGGKDANFYLLDRDNLGGLAGELFKGGLATAQFKGAPAAYTTHTATYVVFHIEGGSGAGCGGGNLVAIKITPGAGTANPTASVAWCAPASDTSLGSPIVTTTDGTSDAIVWDADSHLRAFDGDTGASILTSGNTLMSANMQSWNTPIAIGGGRLAVLVYGQLYVFSAP